MTDAKNDYLRRLHFPPDLERAFQTTHFRRTLQPLRLGIVLTAILLLTQNFRSAFLGGDTDPTLGISAGVFLVLLGASYLPAFSRFWMPTIALSYLCIALAIFTQVAGVIRQNTDYPTPQAQVLVFIVFQTLGMVFCAAGGRLPFFWTMLVLAGIEAGCLGIAMHNFAPSPEVLSGVYLANTLIVLVILMLANLTIERFQRNDFLTNLLLDEERTKSERLLLTTLPAPIAERLKTHSGILADAHPDVSVLFADIVDFTPLSVRLSALEVVTLLNDIFSAFDQLAEKHGLEKIKTIGDTYMVAGGLLESRPDHAEAMAEMALDMQSTIARFQRDTGEALQLRIGIHAGPIVAGVLGTKKTAYDLWGDTVNTASRMESQGIAGGIQTTETVYLHLRDRYRFSPPREIAIKGRGRMSVYSLLGRLSV